MRGPENSKIKLKIMRKGQDKPIEISITRARIQVRSVRSHLEGDDVGFIRVTQFNEQTTRDLKKAITDLSAQAGDKLKSFIIDLRNNPRDRDRLIERTHSWRRARSYRRAAALPRKPNDSMRARASSPRTSRSSC